MWDLIVITYIFRIANQFFRKNFLGRHRSIFLIKTQNKDISNKYNLRCQYESILPICECLQYLVFSVDCEAAMWDLIVITYIFRISNQFFRKNFLGKLKRLSEGRFATRAVLKIHYFFCPRIDGKTLFFSDCNILCLKLIVGPLCGTWSL